METIAINLSTDKHDLHVISAYNSPNKKIKKSDLFKIFNNTLHLGDLKSKSIICGCKKWILIVRIHV